MWFFILLTTIRHQCPISSEPGASNHIISFKLDGDAIAAVEGCRDGGATELLDEESIGDLHIIETTARM